MDILRIQACYAIARGRPEGRIEAAVFNEEFRLSKLTHSIFYAIVEDQRICCELARADDESNTNAFYWSIAGFPISRHSFASQRDDRATGTGHKLLLTFSGSVFARKNIFAWNKVETSGK